MMPLERASDSGSMAASTTSSSAMAHWYSSSLLLRSCSSVRAGDFAISSSCPSSIVRRNGSAGDENERADGLKMRCPGEDAAWSSAGSGVVTGGAASGDTYALARRDSRSQDAGSGAGVCSAPGDRYALARRAARPVLQDERETAEAAAPCKTGAGVDATAASVSVGHSVQVGWLVGAAGHDGLPRPQHGPWH